MTSNNKIVKWENFKTNGDKAFKNISINEEKKIVEPQLHSRASGNDQSNPGNNPYISRLNNKDIIIIKS